MDFQAEDTRAILAALQDVAGQERPLSRDFVLTIDRASGGTATGQIVERTHDGVTLNDPDGQVVIPWDDVQRIAITVE